MIANGHTILQSAAAAGAGVAGVVGAAAGDAVAVAGAVVVAVGAIMAVLPIATAGFAIAEHNNMQMIKYLFIYIRVIYAVTAYGIIFF